MDDLKCKKPKVDRKKNALLIRLRKNVKKKTKAKTKKKGNFKSTKGTSSSVDHLFSQFRKGIGKSRAKDKRGAEGMFFKGLRSKYITRESLNEANEARKNEDINKIIDIGRVFLEKAERPRQCLKRATASSENRQSEILPKSPILFKKTSSNGILDFEQCSLSPISFSHSFFFPPGEDTSTVDHPIRTTKTKKLDLESEFQKFSSKYEQTVGTHVLLRLPDDGVLEDALEVFRKIRNKNANQKFSEGIKVLSDDCSDSCLINQLGSKADLKEHSFLNEFKFLSESQEERVAADKKSTENFISSEKLFIPESAIYEETFMEEKPLGNALIMTDVDSENYYNPSLSPFFDNEVDSLNVLELQQDVEKPTSNLSIATPPIQFYRRNMF